MEPACWVTISMPRYMGVSCELESRPSTDGPIFDYLLGIGYLVGAQMKNLSVKQQLFLSNYLGDDPDMHGNATKSYMAAYGANARSAGPAGKRLLKNVHICTAIAAFQAELQEKMKITAESVLADSTRLRDIAFGDHPFIVQQTITKKDDDGNEYIEIVDVFLRRFQPQAVAKAIELMGKNCVVQAFIEKQEVSHVHYLEERLNERTKKVTAAAEARRLRLAGGTDVKATR